jgi:hypothetical protein
MDSTVLADLTFAPVIRMFLQGLNGRFLTAERRKTIGLLTGASFSVDSGRNRHGTPRLSHNETGDHIARGVKITVSDLPYTRLQWLKITCREGDLDCAGEWVLTEEFAEDRRARLKIDCFEANAAASDAIGGEPPHLPIVSDQCRPSSMWCYE